MTEEQLPPQQPPPDFNIIAQPHTLQGVWANFAKVSRSSYEFTVDFSRIDFETRQGILVARVSMSPLFVIQLIEALQAVFQKYTDEAMPTEVLGDGDDTPSGGSDGAAD